MTGKDKCLDLPPQFLDQFHRGPHETEIAVPPTRRDDLLISLFTKMKSIKMKPQIKKKTPQIQLEVDRLIAAQCWFENQLITLTNRVDQLERLVQRIGAAPVE